MICPNCKGFGYVSKIQYDLEGRMEYKAINCPTCRGFGQVAEVDNGLPML